MTELALRTGNKIEIEKRIQQIEAMEGKGGPIGIVCKVRYLLWQAQPAYTKDKDQRVAFRTTARALLNELSDRRKEWNLVSLLQADLGEQELAEPGLDQAQKLEKANALISCYLSAIGKGDRQPQVVNRVYTLLRSAGRTDEAISSSSTMSLVKHRWSAIPEELRLRLQ